MSEKMKKNAQAAEVQKQNNPSEVQPQAQESGVPSIEDLVKDISEEKVKMAEDLGIPIKGILRWAYGVETTLNALIKELPETVRKNTLAAIQQVQNQYAAQAAAQPSGGTTLTGAGMGGIGDILGLARAVLGSGGGGGQPDPYAEIGKTVVNEVMPKLFSELFQVKIKGYIQRQAEKPAAQP